MPSKYLGICFWSVWSTATFLDNKCTRTKQPRKAQTYQRRRLGHNRWEIRPALPEKDDLECVRAESIQNWNPSVTRIKGETTF